MIEREEQETLVRAIEQHLERPLLSLVREAFLSVPRHPFVQQYYQQEGNRLQWHLVTASREQIEQDEALVTQIDDHGMPSSSTSQPSVMAVQLELLELEADQQVLEIGVGTGYNAALLAKMVGERGLVVSLDIDEALVEQAQEHLVRMGIRTVKALMGDGFVGERTYAPYDRLLATCSFRAIPRAWFEQLKLGGKVVGNWITPLTSLFVSLEKTESDTLIGTLVDLNARYMEMRQPNAVSSRLKVDWTNLHHLPVTHISSPSVKTLLHNPACALLVWSHFPQIQKRFRSYNDRFDLSIIVQETVILLEEHELVVYGDERIGYHLQACIDVYRQLGYPPLSVYHITFSAQEVLIDVADHSFHTLLPSEGMVPWQRA